MFKMKQKVRITCTKYIDGKFDTGTIIGMAYVPSNYILSVTSEKEFIKSFNAKEYKVAYKIHTIDRVEAKWFSEKDLEKL